MKRLPSKHCKGEGSCLQKINRDTYKKNNCKYECKPVGCPNCSEMNPQWTLKNGHCMTCDVLWYAKDIEAYNNRKTRQYCDHCLIKLDCDYHRVDYENSKYPWVRAHVHKMCYYMRKVQAMDCCLDDEGSDID